MKTKHKISSALIISGVLSIAMSALFSIPTASQTAPIIEAQDTIQTVHISAQRLSTEQKMAYDHQYSGVATQTVTITAKRFSPEEKTRIDKDTARSMQANVQLNKILRKTA
ncbi:hypothetical protein BH11PSE12_BH11PSE12_16380 [soil metagenome]